MPRYDEVTIRQAPWVYPVQPEVPEAIRRIVDQLQVGGSPLRVLDVGTGTGIIACALARRGHSVVATDILPAAVALARRNARRNGLTVDCVVSDLTAALPGESKFDVIVFNVPNTISASRAGTLLQHVGSRLLPKRLLERLAPVLVSGTPGQTPAKRSLLERVGRELPRHLAENGVVFLLLQSGDVEQLVRHAAAAALTAQVEPLHAAADVKLVRLDHAIRERRSVTGTRVPHQGGRL